MTNLLITALVLGLFNVQETPKYILIGCSVLLGLFAVIFATWWIHPSFHDFRYFESDFLDYCYTLTTYDQPLSDNGSAYRSRFAGLSSYLLRDALGTIDAIAVSSLIWTGICFGLIFLITSTLQNTTAGLFAVMFALPIAPLHTMGRLVNFYPTIIAFMLFGGFCFVVWSRKNSHTRTLVLGCSIAALFLIDLRGVCGQAYTGSDQSLGCYFAYPDANGCSQLFCCTHPSSLRGTWDLGPILQTQLRLSSKPVLYIENLFRDRSTYTIKK